MNARSLENRVDRLVEDLRQDQYATAHRRLDEVVEQARMLQNLIRNRMANAVEEYAQKAAELRRELEGLTIDTPEESMEYKVLARDEETGEPTVMKPTIAPSGDIVVVGNTASYAIEPDAPDDPEKAQAGGTWEPGDVPTGIGQMKAPEEPAEIRVLPESPAKQTSDRYTQLIEKQRENLRALLAERDEHFQGAPNVQQQSVRPMDAPDESGDIWVYTEEKVSERVEYEEGEID